MPIIARSTIYGFYHSPDHAVEGRNRPSLSGKRSCKTGRLRPAFVDATRPGQVHAGQGKLSDIGCSSHASHVGLPFAWCVMCVCTPFEAVHAAVELCKYARRGVANQPSHGGRSRMLLFRHSAKSRRGQRPPQIFVKVLCSGLAPGSQRLPRSAAKSDDTKTCDRRQEKRQSGGKMEGVFEHLFVSTFALTGAADFIMRIGT